MNKTPLWKYVVILLVMAIGALYAFPNLYGDDPGLQIRGSRGLALDNSAVQEVIDVLATKEIATKSFVELDNGLELRFNNTEDQLKARGEISNVLGKGNTVALTLLSGAPEWARDMGLAPMSLGLDLRGGVHFLLEVDMDAAVARSRNLAVTDLKTELRKAGLRYRKIELNESNSIAIQLRQQSDVEIATKRIRRELPELVITLPEVASDSFIADLDPKEAENIRKFALEQNMTALRNRIDQLGVAEPIVQQQGNDRIVVQLPGVQDTARAKRILGRAATLEMRMVDEKRTSGAEASGIAPGGSHLYEFRDGRRILLKNAILYSGDNIIDAQASIDSQNGGPIVNITIDAKGARVNQRVTGDNIGNRMAVVYLETVTETKKDEAGDVVLDSDGHPVRLTRKLEEVITAPVIRDQLGKRFQISGLDSIQEARDLSLMLRAGALAAPVEIIEERTVGPSLGQDNINKGFASVMYGLIAVLIFMVIYYRVFGLVADVALVMNLVLMVAVLSLFQATLTLPGVAGIVLTVGMAVDANVLIFERIREELRHGATTQEAIEKGYGRAFSTILDANVTTLIAAIVLFSFGTGPIKGFAITLSIGIVTSMFTAIVVSRSIVNFIYGGKKAAKMSI